MIPIEELTAETILSSDLLREVFEEEDELKRAETLASLGLRAQQLRVKGQFNEMVKTFTRVERETRKKEAGGTLEQWTNFSNCPYDRMQCGGWIATDEKIYKDNPFGYTDILACYHPILPLERMKNLETGEEQIKLAYKRNNRWEEFIVPKVMVTSANKIVALSAKGVAVTSETAKYLVQYLADVENANDNYIPVQYSSSKLGWIKDTFLPYDKSIIFDGDSRFKYLFESVHEHGSRAGWYQCIKLLRATGRFEIRMMLAASFASILVSKLDGLPFIVDLWGETEGGKSVTLMVAASVWANPAENQFIGDFKTTEVALEARADMLNNLPVLLDDTSKVSARIKDNFEGTIYDLCSGKGKSRSNKELGTNRENRWSNCILTNGERPLSGYATQGGAINRVLEVECSEGVYDNPGAVVEIIKENYGWAGRDFVDVIKSMDDSEIKDIQTNFKDALASDDKMQKQALSMSILLAADKIATERLFEDGQYISIAEARKCLVDRAELSDNERCYQYLCGTVAMNNIHFDADTKCEKWGIIEQGYAIIISTAFDKLCEAGGHSRKAFLEYAKKRDLIQPGSNGTPTKAKKINGRVTKCVWLRLDGAPAPDGDGFVPVNDGGDDYEQTELPFE